MDEKEVRLKEQLACIDIIMTKFREYSTYHPSRFQILELAEEIAREIEARGT